jgi:hypothetical protein
MCGSGAADAQSAKQPKHDKDDEHKPKCATEAGAAEPAISKVPASAAQEQDYQDDDENRGHCRISFWM